MAMWETISPFDRTVCGYFMRGGRAASVRLPSYILRESGHSGIHTLNE